MAKLKEMQAEKDKALKKLNELKKKQKAEIDARIKDMNGVWNNFCQTFNLDKWQEAQEMWTKLEKEGVQPLPLLQVNSKEIFEKGFSFPEVAKNDEVV